MAALTLFIFSLLVSTNLAINDRRNNDQVVEKEERPAFQALPLHLEDLGDKKIFALNLTYHEVIRGKDSNTQTLVNPNGDDNWPSFGKAVVKDVPLWTNSSQKELYARWQGVAFQSSKDDFVWHNSATIKFEYPALKGSTLQVMGQYVPLEMGNVQWAIVGGTGKFTLAQGVIYGRKRIQDEDEVWIEFKVYGYCFPMAEPKW